MVETSGDDSSKAFTCGGAARAASQGKGMKMTYTYTTVGKAAPFWAAFAAPLVGAPIMIALFAMAPVPAAEAAVEPDVGFVVERLEGPEARAAATGGLEVSDS
jgi:hypothetical protein